MDPGLILEAVNVLCKFMIKGCRKIPGHNEHKRGRWSRLGRTYDRDRIVILLHGLVSIIQIPCGFTIKDQTRCVFVILQSAVNCNVFPLAAGVFSGDKNH